MSWRGGLLLGWLMGRSVGSWALFFLFICLFARSFVCMFACRPACLPADCCVYVRLLACLIAYVCLFGRSWVVGWFVGECGLIHGWFVCVFVSLSLVDCRDRVTGWLVFLLAGWLLAGLLGVFACLLACARVCVRACMLAGFFVWCVCFVG